MKFAMGFVLYHKTLRLSSQQIFVFCILIEMSPSAKPKLKAEKMPLKR